MVIIMATTCFRPILVKTLMHGKNGMDGVKFGIITRFDHFKINTSG